MDTISLLCLIIVGLIIYFLFLKPKESFQNIPKNLVNLQTNQVYNVINFQGKELVSSAFTPVMCNDFMLTQNTQLIPPMQKGWKLKQVTDGLYILEKPQENECLYTHSEMNSPDSLRSYSISTSCKKVNLCGTENLTYENKVDKDSMRTYFRLLQAPNGVYIVSAKNNMYVSLDQNGVSFKTNPDNSSVFTFNKM